MNSRPVVARACAALSALAVVVGPAVVAAAPAHAAPSDIVITELMYHAPDGDATFANLEFIELTNTGPDPVDLSGWSFTAGITLATGDLKLPSGTVVPPGGFLVGSSDTALFSARYGRSADFSYAGTSLSNGGEQVRLVDAAAGVVDDVVYDDAAPWPVAPDGFGPSLELSSLGDDNALATSWHASTVDFGTPGAANSIAPLALSGVVAVPTSPAPNQSFTIQATAPVGSTLSLTSKVMYGADTTVPMLDDAASPGGAGDGVYAATLPGAGAGQLVRYKVAATKGASSATHPPSGDSRPYDGLVVQDPDLGAAQFPVLQWFMEEQVYQDMIANHRCDGVDANATFAWNGKVLDGGLMHIKGHSSCQDAKAKWDVELPSGYTFDFGAPFTYPVKAFDLQNESIPRPRLGWEMIAQSGEEAPTYQTMRIERNGSFFGVFGVLENYDGTFRTVHGWKDAAFYKVEAGGLRTYPTATQLAASGDLDKKNPDDGNYSDAWELTQWLTKPDSPTKRAWLHAHLDLPQLANYTAVTVAMRHWDSGSKNYYVVKNPTTGRWQVLSWDLDGIFNAGQDIKGDFVFPSTSTNSLWTSLAQMPDFLAMHYRRTRTLADQFLPGTTLIDRFDALTVAYANDIALDRATWGSLSLSGARTKMLAGIEERRTQIANHTGGAEIPTSQVAGRTLTITEVNYHPAPGGAEYLEVHNPSSTAVDISGWSVPALGLTARSGTVVPAQSYLTWTRDDAAFVATYGGSQLMAEQYPGALDDAGEEVSLFDGARLVDTVSYSPSAPWPAGADGGGHSIELTDVTADNADPASWVASSGSGSPGSAPGGQPPLATTFVPFGASWSYLSTSSDQGTAWRAPGFDDSAWPSGAAPLGFRSVQTTTIPDQKGRVTYYFRRSVVVPSGAALQTVSLDLKRDDGAVVYVNGVEVARSNMPTGTIGYKTKAVSGVNLSRATTPVTFSLPASALTVGTTNVIAVEVHQYSAGSTADLLFDAELTATR